MRSEPWPYTVAIDRSGKKNLMPNIQELAQNNLDISKYSPTISPQPSMASELPQSLRRNVFLRCPVPPIGTISPDNLTQFNLNGLVPQYRIFLG